MQVLIFTIGQLKLMCSIEHISCIVEIDETKISRDGITYHRDRPILVVRGWRLLGCSEPRDRYMLVLDGDAQLAITVTDVARTDTIDPNALQQVHGQSVALLNDELITLLNPTQLGHGT